MVDGVLGAMMREALRRQQLAEKFDRTQVEEGVEFHMALIPELSPGNKGWLEIARMENGHVAEIVGRTSGFRLDNLPEEHEAEEWFYKVRRDFFRKKEE